MKVPFVLAFWIVVSIATPAASADDLPTPWLSSDIGNVGRPGSASYLDGAFFVRGAGADIWGSADAFRFVYQPVATDGTIVARVTSEQAAHPFAKAGVMFRHSLDPSSPHVILDMKPDGELEFMARFVSGGHTQYLGGAQRAADAPWLKLVRTGPTFTAYQSADGLAWMDILSITLTLPSPEMFAGLVVTSHDTGVLNASAFNPVAVTSLVSPNLLRDPGFEDDVPAALGRGWVSDTYRESPAKSETNQPHTGTQNGACWTPEFLDCGLYQDLIAPTTGLYQLRVHATADRPGGLVGANVNQVLAASSDVEPRAFGDYGGAYTMSFRAAAGNWIRVWMYSPGTPGYVVIDDASLTLDQTIVITGGNWTIGPFFGGTPVGRFTLHGENVEVNGSYDGGIVEPATACAVNSCRPGDTVRLRSEFENDRPLTIASFARGTATVEGTSYPFLEFGGALTLAGGTVTLPAPTGTEFPERVSVSAPFTFSGDLKGFEVLGLRDPKLVFDLVLAGRGTATLELIAGPSQTLTFYQLRYDFEPMPASTR